jgi:hypothetical protein
MSDPKMIYVLVEIEYNGKDEIREYVAACQDRTRLADEARRRHHLKESYVSHYEWECIAVEVWE